MFDIAKHSIVEDDVSIGDGTKIWYFSHVRTKAKIGRNCNIGDYCYIDKKVIIGDDVRIGNKVSIYQGAIIKDRVFIGNGTSFTNVKKPFAYKKAKRYLDTIVEEDVSIGANCTIVAGVKIGRGAIVGDGAVVIRDVPERTFVGGTPAKKLKDEKQIYGKNN